jgi:flagellar protein FliO/FliZ
LTYLKKLIILLPALILILLPSIGALAEEHHDGDRVSEEYGEKNVGNGTSSKEEETRSEMGSDRPYLNQTDEVPFISTLIKMILALLLIIGMIYGLVRLLSRNRSVRLSGPFRLIGGVHLAPNKSVQMIEVGNHLYIVGVGEDVRLLRHIDDQQEMDEIQTLLRERDTLESSEWKLIKNTLGNWAKKRKPDEEISFQTVLSEKLDRFKNRNRRDNHWSSSESNDQDGKPL